MRNASLSAPKFQGFPDDRAAPRRRGPAPSSQAAYEPPAQAPKRKPSVLARVFAPRRLAMLLMIGIGGLAFIGVPLNALFLQDGRHPAPLFAPHPFATPERETAAAPTPPARPAQTDTGRVEAQAAPAEAAKPDAAKVEPRLARAAKADPLKDALKAETPAPAKPEKKREVAARDPIGALLDTSPRAAPAAPPAAAPVAATPAAPDKNIVSAQRALQRLGYVVKPDGMLGAGTRQAIEKFERDNGLPAKGELTPKIAKLLAAKVAAPR